MATAKPIHCAYEGCSRTPEHFRPEACDCEPFPRLCGSHRRAHTHDHQRLAKWLQL